MDWGHFGHLEIGRARRPLMAFVMVLSHSRQIFLRFFLDARMENFLRGHVAAFSAWNGEPRVLLYHNLKSVVLERRGDAIRFIRPCWALPGIIAMYRAPWRSRAAMRRVASSAPSDTYAMASLLPQLEDLDDLNAQAEIWRNGPAADRRCPDEPDRTVREVFAEEAVRLLPLPTTRHHCSNTSRSPSARHPTSAST